VTGVALRTALGLLLVAATLQAQTETGPVTEAAAAPIDLDAMFDEEIVEQQDAVDGVGEAGALGLLESPDAGLLSQAGVVLGGRFTFGLDGNWQWDEYAKLGSVGPDVEALSTDLGATLFFDARPSATFRVFGKAKTEYVALDLDPDPLVEDLSFVFATQIFELFSDFQWQDWVFFRVGKQRADWGVGRFFSPADLISLVTIDPTDPDAEREGPVAVKVHAPLGIHNAYLYLLTDALQEPLDIGVALRGEIVVGSFELGFGGLLQDGLVPKGIITATGALGDVDVFGELLIQRGTERNLITDPTTVVAAEDRDDWFISATLGAVYFDADPGLLISAQYYFNPLGYPGSELRDDALLLSLLPTPTIVPVDLLFFGQHYAAVAVSWSEIGSSDISASASWVGNLSDGSGSVTPAITVRLLDEVSMTLRGTIGYGVTPDESVESLAISASLALGGGAF
jgi:hypothetical protein